MPRLLLPEEALRWFRSRHANQHRAWFEEGGSWPLDLSLGNPIESDMALDPAGFRAWVTAWRNWPGAGEVVWDRRLWPKLGEQSVPSALRAADANIVAHMLSEATAWRIATQRRAELLRRWPALQSSGALGRSFGALANFPDVDFNRLTSLLAWLVEHPDSDMYLRQIPVEGLDTKWLDGKREGLVAGLLGPLVGATEGNDLYTLAGLRREPPRFRMRVLCPSLRGSMMGLSDVEAPLSELAAMPIRANTVLMVENKQTGLALEDIPGTVALFKLGYAAQAVCTMPWVRSAQRVIYWGDIDTHGLAALALVRRLLPTVAPILMDETALLQFQHLWTSEPGQAKQSAPDGLAPTELDLFSKLKRGHWGPGVRLEQERLPWSLCKQVILDSIAAEGG